MPIHQALFAKKDIPSTDWSVVDTHRLNADGSTFTLNNLQQNDFIVVFAGADSNSLTGTSITGHTIEARGQANNISYYVSYIVHNSASTSYSFSFAGQSPDYAVAIAFRRGNAYSSYSYQLLVGDSGSGTPNHGNTSVSFAINNLALLVAWVDDDDASPMVAPTDSTLASADFDGGNGSIGVAFKDIKSAGSYSWGSWTTTGTDNWLADVVKITGS